jgi:dolichol kinase
MTEEVIAPTVDANGVDLKSKIFIAIIMWILGIMYFIDSPIAAVIVAVISWYWFGPYLARYARDHGRDATWGFAIGTCFAIVGILVYWFYEYVTRPRSE